jgi:hypothetical protein
LFFIDYFRQFDYLFAVICVDSVRVNCIVDYIRVDCGSPRSGAHRCALAQTIDNARGLDINLPLSAENHPQDLRFHQHQQHGNPNSARGLDNNSASDRGCDSTTTTRLRHH